jgi:hypothetical protein
MWEGIRSPFKELMDSLDDIICYCTILTVSTKLSHASRAEKKTLYIKNRQNSKESLLAISMTQNFRIHELTVETVTWSGGEQKVPK